MATVTLKGNPIHTTGELPKVGEAAPDFSLVKNDLGEITLKELKGKTVILNIFPSIDTPVCATSTRRFNQELDNLENTVVLCVSQDLPFASKRFCGSEGLEKVLPASAFRSEFGNSYGVSLQDGPLKGLFARAILVVDPEGKVKYTELVPEIGQEPNYEAAIASVG